MINRTIGEPILPARTADQYLARYWSAVRAGKIGSPVMRFIKLDGTLFLKALNLATTARRNFFQPALNLQCESSSNPH
jgi:hypothetical protein